MSKKGGNFGETTKSGAQPGTVASLLADAKARPSFELNSVPLNMRDMCLHMNANPVTLCSDMRRGQLDTT